MTSSGALRCRYLGKRLGMVKDTMTFSVGGMVGGLMCGWLADKWGRKGAMMFNNLIALAAAILMSMSKYADLYHLLILGRLVVGLNCGKSSR